MKTKVIYALLFGIVLYSIQVIYQYMKLGDMKSVFEKNGLISLFVCIIGGFLYLFISQYLLKDKSPDGKI